MFLTVNETRRLHQQFLIVLPEGDFLTLSTSSLAIQITLMMRGLTLG